MKKAKISEIFLSLQGEGLHFGLPQLFIRFYDCNLSCNFCDTSPKSFKAFSKEKLLEAISKYKKPYHSVSLTGGEPLLQADFLEGFLWEYKKSYKKPIYLETNGTLPDALRIVIDYVDIIAMDFKLPSSAGGMSFWVEHERFLQIARVKKVFVKTVITQNTSPVEIAALSEMVGRISDNIPVILQPATVSKKSSKVDFEKLRRLRSLLRESVKRVDIIPQVHKLIGIR